MQMAELEQKMPPVMDRDRGDNNEG